MEDNKESIKNIAEQNLQVIFNSLQLLKFYEKNMRNGCADLISYIEAGALPQNSLSYIRVKNMELMITEFDIVLSDTQQIIDTKKHKKMMSTLKAIQKVIAEGIGKDKDKPFHESVDLKRQRTMNITSLFPLIEKHLSQLRGDLVNSLSHILFVQRKSESKSKKVR